jgi:ornithine cyclodeaminase/alanine dehydrogenase-like protein (mu-crystallin family)
MRRARVIVDDLAECASGGDLHHALEANVMTLDDVHADLGSVVAATKPGRVQDQDTIVFDSTGIALEDAAAAGLLYELALADGSGIRVRLADADG